MSRYALSLVIGLVLGLMVHLLTTMAMPQLALEDAYGRVERLGPHNTMIQLPDPAPFTSVLPRMDPAFAHAVCRYNLSGGAMRVRVPLTPDYTSISFYTRHGLPYYAINDRAAGRRAIDLHLMTAAQRAALPVDEEITAADRLIVESPSREGLVFVRALVRERGLRETVKARLAESICVPAG